MAKIFSTTPIYIYIYIYILYANDLSKGIYPFILKPTIGKIIQQTGLSTKVKENFNPSYYLPIVGGRIICTKLSPKESLLCEIKQFCT